MKAYCMDGRIIDVIAADEYVKQVIEEAAYMADAGAYTLTLSPSKEAEIRTGYEYTFYKVNGTLYESCFTNKHAELVKFYGDKTLCEQLSLF